MLFFGHRFIKSEPFYHVYSTDAISSTPPSSTIYFEFDEANFDLLEYAKINGVSFAIKAHTLSEVAYASALGASFIVVDSSMAKDAQQIAENYLFDSKILALIKDEHEIEKLLYIGVDGVIFYSCIVKISN